MDFYLIPLNSPVKYGFTGKFETADPEWKHMHRVLVDYELIIMNSGTLYLSSSGNEYTLTTGGSDGAEYLLMPPGAYQFGYQSSECSFYWLHFSHAGETKSFWAADFDEARVEKDEDKIVLPARGSVQNFEKIIIYMKQLQDSVRKYNNSILNNYMSAVILCELFSQLEMQSSGQLQPRKMRQFYNDIIDYVQYYINTNIKVSDVAEHFGYNQKYISHMFKTFSGISLKKYITQKKIDQAKFLLSDTNDTISEIACSLGYSDVHNFMKVFKKETEVTPSEYRNIYSQRMLFYE